MAVTREGQHMDSSVGQLERLLKEGANFTFANFSIRDAAQGFQYGGADSPAWLTWKTRAFNTIHALLASFCRKTIDSK